MKETFILSIVLLSLLSIMYIQCATPVYKEQQTITIKNVVSSQRIKRGKLLETCYAVTLVGKEERWCNIGNHLFVKGNIVSILYYPYERYKYTDSFID